ncbi:hypothetical protein CP971_06740 [Streptomyces viridifaciens]|nr:hypothetical protein CP971_06740 [Streptomyces viridifaciens]
MHRPGLPHRAVEGVRVGLVVRAVQRDGVREPVVAVRAARRPGRGLGPGPGPGRGRGVGRGRGRGRGRGVGWGRGADGVGHVVPPKGAGAGGSRATVRSAGGGTGRAGPRRWPRPGRPRRCLRE